MLTFAVCLLFGAHPDAFLPEPEFGTKYLVKYIELVNKCRQSLSDSVDDILQKSIDDRNFAANHEQHKNLVSVLDKSITLFGKKRGELVFAGAHGRQSLREAIRRARLTLNPRNRATAYPDYLSF